MYAIKGIVFCVLLGFASCNFDCFQKHTSECVTNHFKDLDVGSDGFCDVQLAIYRCNKNAAVKCKPGFETEAKRAYAVVKEVCTKGTELYNDFNSDKACLSQIFSENHKCNEKLNKDLNKPGLDHRDVIEHNKILCRRVDEIRECTNKRVGDFCKSETADVIRIIMDNAVTLQKKICYVLPVKGKRASEHRNVYSPLLFAV